MDNNMFVEVTAKLLAEKQRILNSHKAAKELKVSAERMSDKLDTAALDSEQNVSLELRNKELMVLKNIEAALCRLEEGVYGKCEECEEAIENNRLMAHPFAVTCVSCQEAKEKSTKGQRSNRQVFENALKGKEEMLTEHLVEGA